VSSGSSLTSSCSEPDMGAVAQLLSSAKASVPAQTRCALSNIVGLRTAYEAVPSSANSVRRRIRLPASVRKSPGMSAISDSD